VGNGEGTAEPDRHCPRCGYDLGGVPVVRARITCPECALSVQVRELPSPAKDDEAGVEIALIAGWGIAATVGLTVLGVFVSLFESSRSLSTPILLFSTMTGVLGPLVCTAAIRPRKATHGVQESRVVPLIAWFVLGVLSAAVLLVVNIWPKLLSGVVPLGAL
jgi:hypothetical protein